MKVGILGTGVVGTTLGTKLAQLGHEVKLGARAAGNEKAVAWVKSTGPRASQGTFFDAANFGELLFNCTSGGASLQALDAADRRNLDGKVLVDVSNPLDFSKGMPPTLSVVNTDSQGERIQKSYPAVRVVKALNTLAAPRMVNPAGRPRHAALQPEAREVAHGTSQAGPARGLRIGPRLHGDERVLRQGRRPGVDRHHPPRT